MKILVLDDSVERMSVFEHVFKGEKLYTAWNSDEAIQILKDESPFDLVYLDHDLEDVHYTGMYGVKYERTGMDVVEYMVRSLTSNKMPTMTIIHSWNVSAAKSMGDRLRDAGFPVRVEPYKPPTNL